MSAAGSILEQVIRTL